MSSLVLFFVFIYNLVVSFWNAKVCGENWVEANAIGGWSKALIWSGAIMSAIGFTQTYFIVGAVVGTMLNIAPPEVIQIAMNLLYVMIAIPCVLTGLIICIHSWVAFAKEKSIKNGGVAVWNTIIQGYNTYHVFNSFGAVIDNLSETFKDKKADRDNKNGAIILAIVCLGLGIFTTYVLIKRYASTKPVQAIIQ